MKRVLLGFAIVSSVFAFAQKKEHISSFSSIAITYKASEKFYGYLEGQVRGIEDFSYVDYYEIKGGLGYYLTKNHKPFIGIGRYATYADQKIDKEEFRVWLQDIIDYKVGVVKFENRFRAEQSWFYEPQTDENSKRTRFRYRLNVQVPLNAKEMKPGTLFVNAYDEVFFVTTKPSFARNRVYTGLGFQINDEFGIAGGYLWQREFSANKNRSLHFMYLAVNINLDKGDEKIFDFPGAD